VATNKNVYFHIQNKLADVHARQLTVSQILSGLGLWYRVLMREGGFQDGNCKEPLKANIMKSCNRKKLKTKI
jgi:hypothetical protein